MQYELNIDPRYLIPDSEIGGLSWSAPRTLDKAISLTSGRSGVYKVYQRGRLLYIGESGDLRDRFMDHRLCVHRFNVPGPITVRYAYFSGTKSNRVQIQDDLITYYRNRKGHRITNIRELEEELASVY